MSRLGQTPSSTVGPYFSMKLAEIAEMADDDTRGQRIRIEGRVLDGAGEGVEDAMIEVWQANAEGRYRHPADLWASLPVDEGFSGYGRVHTDFATGTFAIDTIKPGPVPGPGGGHQAPHLNLIVTARGMLHHLFTRVYFGDEEEANARDPVLARVAAERRPTLMARSLPDRDPSTYRFDVRLQGDHETVFFDV